MKTNFTFYTTKGIQNVYFPHLPTYLPTQYKHIWVCNGKPMIFFSRCIRKHTYYYWKKWGVYSDGYGLEKKKCKICFHGLGTIYSLSVIKTFNKFYYFILHYMKFFLDSFIYTTKTHSQNDIVWVHMSAMGKKKKWHKMWTLFFDLSLVGR
jgi:hypothetical protein